MRMSHALRTDLLLTARDNSLHGGSSRGLWEEVSQPARRDHRDMEEVYQPARRDHGDTEEEDTPESRQRLRPLRTRQLLFDGARPVPRLRPPLALISFQGVRWPIECDVIKDVVQHIEWDPPEPEPFYQATGYERAPMGGEERGSTVYCMDPATRRPYFTGSRVGGSRGPVRPAGCGARPGDGVLEFEARFESGNLQRAVRVGVHDYELTVRTDLYTTKHTQWFYFRVRNMRAGPTYRFTITNLAKARSLYSQGLRPLLYSSAAARGRGVGWHRVGANIRYYNNNQARQDSPGVAQYSLTWTCQFPYDSDTCYLAHSYPYTYSHLQRYLSRLVSHTPTAAYCQLRVLCRSLAGNDVHVLSVTSPGRGAAERGARRAVVVTARVHPGETTASWMMEGFLDFLLGESDDAQLLRDTFVFKVVPMLNPDGVVVGNYRCSLAGRDLNRNYSTLLRESFPSVWHTRALVQRLVAERDVVLYCDFHGHSRKNNVFMYGCNNRDASSLQLQERVFPLMMSKNAADKFSFRSCKFRVQKGKKGTGRVAMWRLGVRNSYTMEATFGGSTLGHRKGTHFSTRDLKSLGYDLCDTLLDLCDPDPIKTRRCLTELSVLLRQEVKDRLGRELDSDCNVSVSDLESSTSGSNSTNSDGLPVHLLNQADAGQAQGPLGRKRKQLRSRKERNRRQQERVKSTEPRSITDTEPDLPNEEEVKVGIQERTTLREKKREKVHSREEEEERRYTAEKKREKVDSEARTALVRGPTTGLGVNHVILWQYGQPIKDECLQAMRAAYIHRRTRTHPHLPCSRTKPPHTGQPEERGKRHCSTQQLHLSAPVPRVLDGKTQVPSPPSPPMPRVLDGKTQVLRQQLRVLEGKTQVLPSPLVPRVLDGKTQVLPSAQQRGRLPASLTAVLR